MSARVPPSLRPLWSPSAPIDEQMFAYTVGDDRTWDSALLRWDVIGSLGHVAGLRAARILSLGDHRKLERGLRKALRAIDQGTLGIGMQHEDAHSAVEDWLTRTIGPVGERLHTGRSRNDQVACDLRLLLKDELLAIHSDATDLVAALVEFSGRHQQALWPGYTHTRRAMPSSAGLWAAGFAEGLLDGVESLPALWARLDRSPLGSAAGYGVPLPIDRERTAKALGFARAEHNVTAVQNGRGKLEAAALFWCLELAHDLSRLATDVVLYSGEEFGLLLLPADLATGSSIMPHKRNPDLFELTRARAAALEGDLAAVLSIKAKLTSGYHRDFQFLKEPLMRGLRRTREMLVMMTAAVPKLVVQREYSAGLLRGDILATDEVMRRVEAGVSFRTAYRAVAAELKRGVAFPIPSAAELRRRRKSVGGLGALGLAVVRSRARQSARWAHRERARFAHSIGALTGAR